MELLDVSTIVVDPDLALSLPPGLAVRRQLLPFAIENDHVHIACADPDDQTALQAAERHLGKPVVAEAAEPIALRRAIERITGGNRRNPLFGRGTLDIQTRTLDLEGETAIGLVDDLLAAALLQRASDLHLDPGKELLQVRLRIDGQIHDYRQLPLSTHSALVGRLKVLAGLDIAERRSPQDGRFRHGESSAGQGEVDVRVATLPTRHGEKVTLRLLDSEVGRKDLAELGLDAGNRERLEQTLARPFGLALLTGPTGSGKSTTLYAALQHLIGARALNALTVEDPVEYEVPGVSQVEVTRGDKLGFHKALRHLLRHDPDVLMIGEIRDHESADVAIKSALTGHLVLSTLHTNSALGAITRLADLGIERFLIAATLRLVAAQRLARRLCARCAEPDAVSKAAALSLGDPGIEGARIARADGCRYCAGRGTIGRLGLFESIALDEAWSERIAAGAVESELARYRRELEIPTLAFDTRSKLLAGKIGVQDAVACVAAW